MEYYSRRNAEITNPRRNAEHCARRGGNIGQEGNTSSLRAQSRKRWKIEKIWKMKRGQGRSCWGRHNLLSARENFWDSIAIWAGVGSLWGWCYAPPLEQGKEGKGGSGNRPREWQGLRDWCLSCNWWFGIGRQSSNSPPGQGQLLRLWRCLLHIAVGRRQVCRSRGNQGAVCPWNLLASPNQLL